MKTLALVNQKGGCGKTTTAVNLAGALAVRGERVLLVDLDPQAHATMALSVCVEPGERSIADVLLRGTSLGEVVRAARGGIALVPATLELGELEEAAGRTLHPERLLSQALSEVELDYDYALLDCPPRADGVLTANALRAADVAVLVIEMGAFALQGALKAEAVFAELAGDMDARFELRAVGTLFDRHAALARELLIGTQARFGARLFDSVIHQSGRLREAAASGQPVQILDPACRAARDFQALAEEVCALWSPVPLHT
ncbi:MAG: ParA family protein [Planctomycetes bacterium]|nr:ParA family protein [Planctomycetota bacterium]